MLKTRLIKGRNAEKIAVLQPFNNGKEMGPSLVSSSQRHTFLLSVRVQQGGSRRGNAIPMALTSPRGSNVSQYQWTRSIRFVWAGWRSRHEALCDDHDGLNLNRASDLFESLLGVHIQRLLLSLSHSHVLVLSNVQFICSGFIYCLLSCPPPPSFSDFF